MLILLWSLWQTRHRTTLAASTPLLFLAYNIKCWAALHIVLFVVCYIPYIAGCSRASNDNNLDKEPQSMHSWVAFFDNWGTGDLAVKGFFGVEGWQTDSDWAKASTAFRHRSFFSCNVITDIGKSLRYIAIYILNAGIHKNNTDNCKQLVLRNMNKMFWNT